MNKTQRDRKKLFSFTIFTISKDFSIRLNFWRRQIWAEQSIFDTHTSLSSAMGRGSALNLFHARNCPRLKSTINVDLKMEHARKMILMLCNWLWIQESQNYSILFPRTGLGGDQSSMPAASCQSKYPTPVGQEVKIYFLNWKTWWSGNHQGFRSDRRTFHLYSSWDYTVRNWAVS